MIFYKINDFIEYHGLSLSKSRLIYPTFRHYHIWFNVYKEKIDVFGSAILRFENTSNEIQYPKSANGASSRR